MVCFFPVIFSPATRRFPVVILALSWICGLLAGTVIAFSADISTVSLMHPVLSSPVSIVSLFITQLLPVFVSAFAVMISRLWLFYFIAFADAFLLTYTGIGAMRCFGLFGWLPACLLQFMSCLCSAAVLWLLISHMRHPVSGIYRRFFLAIASVILFCAWNYQCFLPFLLDIFSI